VSLPGPGRGAGGGAQVVAAEGRAVVRTAETAGPEPPPTRGRIWPAGLILCLLAIGLRILVASRREGIEIDGMTYLANAQALRGNWRAIDVLHPPLYSVILAPFLGLWRDPEWGARVISSVLGGLWVWPTLWLARQTTEERVAWTAALLVAFMPAGV
jgi:predicted membrane-bound mannosyltransferase